MRCRICDSRDLGMCHGGGRNHPNPTTSPVLDACLWPSPHLTILYLTHLGITPIQIFFLFQHFLPRKNAEEVFLLNLVVLSRTSFLQSHVFALRWIPRPFIFFPRFLLVVLVSYWRGLSTATIINFTVIFGLCFGVDGHFPVGSSLKSGVNVFLAHAQYTQDLIYPEIKRIWNLGSLGKV